MIRWLYSKSYELPLALQFGKHYSALLLLVKSLKKLYMLIKLPVHSEILSRSKDAETETKSGFALLREVTTVVVRAVILH